ncbi:MAG: methylmalonyl-CoA epimerase [Thermoleophilia bacterium]
MTRLHHVAYVVHDLDAALPVFTERYGLEVTIRELMPEQGVEAVMLGAGEGAVELIAPVDPESGVARYLEKRGEGLHHIALEVEDLAGALDELRAQGVELIDQEPRVGLGGHLIAFVHPKSGLGALTELVQAGH